MTTPDRPVISFLDDDGNELAAEEIVSGDAGSGRAPRRLVVLDRWVPEGSSGAVAALVFVLVAWFGTQPIVSAVTALLPQGQHRIGPLTEESVNFGGSTVYFGVTPGLLPVVAYGVPAAFALLALLLARRARRLEHSSVAHAAVIVTAVSLGLFVAAGVATAIGISLGHQTSTYF